MKTSLVNLSLALMVLALAGNVYSQAPDKARIAFSRTTEPGMSDIYIMDTDGSDLVNLTNDPALSNIMGDWSPDGRRIVFWTMVENGIYIMDADGSNKKRLTKSSQGNSDRNPSWSPDGAKIAFDSNNMDENWDVYVMDTDGGNMRNLTEHPARDGVPAWSPDGTKIAFVSDRNERWGVYIMDADGRNPEQLTIGIPYELTWAPDGGQIAFESTDENSHQIYLADADRMAEARKISIGNGDYMDPCWSPDGTEIVFSFHEAGIWKIYVMNADGTNERELTDGPADERPKWFAPATDFNKIATTWGKIKSEY